MLGMNRSELTRFLQKRLQPIEVALQKHIPQYCNQWDDLITAVAWLLRSKKFWHNPKKAGREPLVIPYDLVPNEGNYSYTIKGVPQVKATLNFKEIVLSEQEEETVKKLQDYFVKVLRNVEFLLNIRFKHQTLHTPSSSVRQPQLRLFFFKDQSIAKEKTYTAGVTYLPSAKAGGDIWINLCNARGKLLTDLSTPQQTIIHELGHALGLPHFHSEGPKDCGCDVRGYKILSPPPSFFMGDKKEERRGRAVFHEYANIANTVMAYSRWSNITLYGFKLSGHFGYLDYMALICAYGPNRNNSKLEHMTKSYETGELSRDDINLDNYGIIKEIIPKRTIQYKQMGYKGTDNLPAFRLTTQHNSSKEPKHTIQLDDAALSTRSKFDRIKVAGKGQRILLHTDIPTYIDGFAGYTQVTTYQKRYKKGFYDFEIVLSPETPLSTVRGSSDQDFVFFNKNIEYVSGEGGLDTYCFFQDKWGKHVIEEQQDKIVNYVVLYQPDLSRLDLYRFGNDLIIFDPHQPKKKNIKFKGYFLSKALNYSAFHNSYVVLIVHKEKIDGADNIPCFRNQFVSIMKLKTEELRSKNRMPFTKNWLMSLRNMGEVFQKGLMKLRPRGPDHIISFNANKYDIDRNHNNRDGTTIRLHSVLEYTVDKTLTYIRQGNNLLIRWRIKDRKKARGSEGKKRICGFSIPNFFAKDTPPVHLVGTEDNYLMTFNSMNGEGPIHGINPYAIKTSEWHRVRFPG